MARTVDSWAWSTTSVPNTGGNDLNGGLDGSIYTMGTNLDYHLFGEVQMVDGDDDDLINDTDVDDGTDASNGDGMNFGGSFTTVNEVTLYDNTVITYTSSVDGSVKTWTTTGRLWQLSNGTTLIRVSDGDRDLAPTDFYIQNVTQIQLGTWTGIEYNAGVVPNFDDPPPNVCFTSGTLIETRSGLVPVEDLRIGDLVLTMDAGYQPIRWIGGRKVSAADLRAAPRLRPIRICADALGPGLPRQDLLVSPQHRVLVRSPVAARMFGSAEVLIPAKKLLDMPGIYVDDAAEGVEYFHILFEAHHLIWSNGAVTESLFTGPEAMKAVSPEAREEIAALFPRILEPGFIPDSARTIPRKGKDIRHLVQTIASQNKPVQGPDTRSGRAV